MAYPLLANPNKHYYPTRNSPILGIVLHVTAGLEDFTPPDSGAEATIRYGQSNTRPASWHGIVDSDSVIDCLPDNYTAFHCIGLNSPSLGLEIANRDAKWATKPEPWAGDTLKNGADWCRPRVAKYGLPIRLSTAAEVRAAVNAGRPFGFTYHRYMDPSRRIDPGFDFPWNRFETLLRGGGSAAADDANLRVKGPFPLSAGHWYGRDDGSDRSHSGVRDRDEVAVQQIQASVGAGVDGEFGPGTESKVKAWQASKDLPATGRVDADTWAAMLGGTADPVIDVAARKPAPAPAPVLRVKGPFPLPVGHWFGEDDKTARSHSGKQAKDEGGVRQVQSEVGVTVDGAYGPGTTAGVKKWQTARKVAATGKVDAATWARMLTS